MAKEQSVSMKKTMERLKKSKQHRAAYVSSQINIGLPFQIRALRKQRDWDQKTLAKYAEMAQPRISAMENAGYGQFTLETLKRLANAFDVGLIVRFAPLSELVRWSDRFYPDEFIVASFEDEVKQMDSLARNVLSLNFVTSGGASGVNTAQTGASGYPLPESPELPKYEEQERVVPQYQRAA